MGCSTTASLCIPVTLQATAKSPAQISTIPILQGETPSLWQQLPLQGVQRREIYLVDYALCWSIYGATTLLFIFMIMIIKGKAS